MTEDKIISELESEIKRAEYVDRDYVDGVDVDLLSSSLELIKRQKEALDVVPVKHGEWEGYTHSRFYGTDKNGEPIYRDGVLYYCSECRRRSIIKTNYCPNCGTKMDKGSEENNND